MPREPDPMSGCRPGGHCPVCNPPPVYCSDCGDVEVDEKGERCPECELLAADDEPATEDYGSEH